METRQKGKVLWFSDAKGFGYICPEGYEPMENDIFFYYAYIQMEGFKTVKPDTVVSFDIGENHQGPMAINISIEGHSSKDED